MYCEVAFSVCRCHGMQSFNLRFRPFVLGIILSQKCRTPVCRGPLSTCDWSDKGPAHRMWSRTSLTAPSSGRHSCFSKSACSCALALSASVTNSRRVRNANLQTSQYAVFGVLPMNLTILSFRSGMATSWQGVNPESNTLSAPWLTGRTCSGWQLFTTEPGRASSGLLDKP